jgi:chemotaxis protein methyltransferase CheR
MDWRSNLKLGVRLIAGFLIVIILAGGWAGKYFNAVKDEFRVKDNIRRKVVFKLHDLTRDPFEENFDLVICRNVVIYFSEDAKKKLRRRFLDALKINRVLFIGAAETMLDAVDTGFQHLSPCF